MNEEVPLRAVLKCVHGAPLTAGNSKGKRKYYWYYKNDCCKKPNLSAKLLHDQLDEIWKTLSLPSHYILYLQQTIEKKDIRTAGANGYCFSSKKKRVIRHSAAVR